MDSQGAVPNRHPERLVFVKFLLRQASRLLWEPKDGAQSSLTVEDGRGLDESGQDLAEYALLIGLIALVVIGAVTLLGTQLVAAYNNIAGTLPFGGS
jgi:pilus assembly protein Flp/PilA